MKNKKEVKTLSESLNLIYNIEDLSTTQTCKCHCCQVAMPQITYSEFINIATIIWDKSDSEKKLEFLKTSLKYFMRHEFEKFGISSLVKPCMFLANDGKCSIYENRPLSCRMFGLWPNEVYEDRVDKFIGIYENYGLSRDDLPLHKQCESVKRNSGGELTKEIIDGIYDKLQSLDKNIGDFSDLQLQNRENVRTFHDWLLLKVFGEEWLEMMTTFVLAASKENIQDQMDAFDKVLTCEFIEKISI